MTGLDASSSPETDVVVLGVGTSGADRSLRLLGADVKVGGIGVAVPALPGGRKVVIVSADG